MLSGDCQQQQQYNDQTTSLLDQQHDDGNNNEIDVWDQLSDLHSREIQQHHQNHAVPIRNMNNTISNNSHRIRNSNSHNNNNIPARKMLLQAKHAMEQTATVLTTAAAVAKDKVGQYHQDRKRYYDVGGGNTSSSAEHVYNGPYSGQPPQHLLLHNNHLSQKNHDPHSKHQFAEFGFQPNSLTSFLLDHEHDVHGIQDDTYNNNNNHHHLSTNSQSSYTHRSINPLKYLHNGFSLKQQDLQPPSMNDPLLSNPTTTTQHITSTNKTTFSSSNSNIHSSSNHDFHWLDQFRLLPQRDGIELAANLDLYLTSLYNLYYHRGLVPIIGKGVLDIVSLFFTLWLSVFIFVYLDWRQLILCVDESSCYDSLQMYIIDQPFSQASFWNFLVILYILLFTAYGIFTIMTFLTTVKNAKGAKHIYEDKLGISMRKLEGGAVEWHQIVEILLRLQEKGEYRVAINGRRDGNVGMKDELVVAQRILRRENFMVAFFNRNILDLTIPWPFPFGGRPLILFYSKSLEWSIYFCVLSYMFNHKYQIRPSFYADPVSLKRRFFACGIAHLIFMPFLLIFIILHFFMQNLYGFRSSQQYMGPREWSDIAKWTFREFNELPHVFERRLGPSYDAAEDYLKLFTPSSIISSLGRLLVFFSGSLGALFIGLAAINDAILLHVKLGNWNLLWYVGVLGVVYSIGNSLLPGDVLPRYHHNLFGEMDSALSKVTSHTHHYPEFWKKRGWDDVIKKKFNELYQFKVKLFLIEVASVIVAPIILCFSLPNVAKDICSFVQRIKIEVPGAGDHCGFSTFDFDIFADESWEGQTMKVGTDDPNDERKEAIESMYKKLKSTPRPMARHGKMEKSFFNFKSAHPNWKCSSSGQDLVNRMKIYQTQQAVALARERQHHIAAAALQLETLQKLETISSKSKLDSDNKNHLPPIDEHHITTTACNSGADDSNFEERSKSSFQEVPNQMTSSLSTTSETESVLDYTDIGLSTELQNILNNSALDPDESTFSLSTFGSGIHRSLYSKSNNNIMMIDGELQEGNDSNKSLQRQYMLLEKYHSQNKPLEVMHRSYNTNSYDVQVQSDLDSEGAI